MLAVEVGDPSFYSRYTCLLSFLLFGDIEDVAVFIFIFIFTFFKVMFAEESIASGVFLLIRNNVAKFQDSIDRMVDGVSV